MKEEKSIDNSLFVLYACESNELVGLIRAVGDGFSIINIQDILVLESYQRMVIGKKLIESLLSKYQRVRQIVLIIENLNKIISFYEAVGFKKINELGCIAFMK